MVTCLWSVGRSASRMKMFAPKTGIPSTKASRYSQKPTSTSAKSSTRQPPEQTKRLFVCLPFSVNKMTHLCHSLQRVFCWLSATYSIESIGFVVWQADGCHQDKILRSVVCMKMYSHNSQLRCCQMMGSVLRAVYLMALVTAWRRHSLAMVPYFEASHPSRYCSTVLVCIWILLIGHNGGVTSASWSHDGNWLLTASSDKAARLWSVRQPDNPLITVSQIQHNFKIPSTDKVKVQAILLGN